MRVRQSMLSGQSLISDSGGRKKAVAVLSGQLLGPGHEGFLAGARRSLTADDVLRRTTGPRREADARIEPTLASAVDVSTPSSRHFWVSSVSSGS